MAVPSAPTNLRATGDGVLPTYSTDFTTLDENEWVSSNWPVPSSIGVGVFSPAAVDTTQGCLTLTLYNICEAFLKSDAAKPKLLSVYLRDKAWHNGVDLKSPETLTVTDLENLREHRFLKRPCDSYIPSCQWMQTGPLAAKL